jgi:plasmid maintenance system antidote protein VapI
LRSNGKPGEAVTYAKQAHSEEPGNNRFFNNWFNVEYEYINDLAIKSDVEKAILVRICNEGRNVTAKTLYKISRALEVSPF